MILDGILSFVYGMFEKVFSILPIPAIPEWYMTEIFPVISVYVRKAVKLVSFAFPSEQWAWAINFVKDMILIRLVYRLYCKFHPFSTPTT